MVQPLTFLNTIFNRKGTAYIIEKWYPFHIPTQQHCVPFLNPWHEVRDDVTGEHQALPEEFLMKKKILE